MSSSWLCCSCISVSLWYHLYVGNGIPVALQERHRCWPKDNSKLSRSISSDGCLIIVNGSEKQRIKNSIEEYD